jgi:hypothetical protein|tara:strand:+ start:642 stop:1946 length:1305 start_codon:yes stop_codon:yes gene_type:complete
VAQHGEAHPDVAARYASVGALYCTADDPSTANEYLAEAIRVEESTRTAFSRISLARFLNGLATCRIALGDPFGARAVYTRALEHLRRVLPNDVAAAVAREEEVVNRTFFCDELAEGVVLEEYATHTNMVAILGEGGTLNTVADVLNNLGLLMKSNNAVTAATRLCARAVSLGTVALGRSSPANALRLRNLGAVLVARGKVHEAVQRFTAAYNDCLLWYGEEHPETNACLEWLKWAKGNQVGGHEESDDKPEGVMALPEVAEWFLSLLFCGAFDSPPMIEAAAVAGIDAVDLDNWHSRETSVTTPNEFAVPLSPNLSRVIPIFRVEEGPLHPLDPRDGEDLLGPYQSYKTTVPGGEAGALVWSSIAAEISEIADSGSAFPRGKNYITDFLRQAPDCGDLVKGYAHMPRSLLLPYSAFSGYGSSRTRVNVATKSPY